MKYNKPFCLILCLFHASFVFTQQVDSLTYYHDYIDVNNIKARVNSNSTLFWDFWDNAEFYAPKGSNNSTIFAADLWIGAKDTNNQLYLAAQDYIQNSADFFPNLNYVAKINKLQIDKFLTLGTQSNAIKNWPAKGNTITIDSSSFFIEKDFAPFIDINNDGIYNTDDGDYPDIKGDQMLWWSFNDYDSIHTASGGKQLGIDINASMYAYNCINDSALYNTIFLDYTIINNSLNRYDSVYVGLWADFDIGYYEDDYIGCDTTLNLFYGYNGDSADGPYVFQYQGTPPAQGILFLNNLITHFIKYNRTGMAAQADPEFAHDYYNYLRSLWKDSTHVTYGGNGYGDSIITNFMFSGDPVTKKGWIEETPHDIRGTGSIGPFALNPKDKKTVSLAFIFANAINGNNTASITLLREYVKYIQSLYDNNSLQPCDTLNGIVNKNFENKISFKISPNPFDSKTTVEYSIEKNFDTALINIFDVTGNMIKSYKLSEGNNNFTISASEFKSGIYYCKLILNGILQDGGKMVVLK